MDRCRRTGFPGTALTARTAPSALGQVNRDAASIALQHERRGADAHIDGAARALVRRPDIAADCCTRFVADALEQHTVSAGLAAPLRGPPHHHARLALEREGQR